MTTLTVTNKGQVTLHKELLGHLGIRPGQRLDVEVLPEGRIQIQAERPRGSIDAFLGLLAPPGAAAVPPWRSLMPPPPRAGRALSPLCLRSCEDHGGQESAGTGCRAG
jgi:hypothetical protein